MLLCLRRLLRARLFQVTSLTFYCYICTNKVHINSDLHHHDHELCHHHQHHLKIVGPCCTLHSGRWTLGSKLCHDLHCCHELCHHHRHQQHTTSRCGSRCCYLHTTETEEFTVPVSFSVMRPPSPQYETMSSVVTIHATPT
jgi:hypothetical protein